MSSPFRDDSGAAHARVDQLEGELEELERENARLRDRQHGADTEDVAAENARLREENKVLRVALESKRRESLRRELPNVCLARPVRPELLSPVMRAFIGILVCLLYALLSLARSC